MTNMFLVLSIVIIVIQFRMLISNDKKLKYIIEILNDIISGNINRRIILNNNSKSIVHLVNNINNVLDNIREIQNEKNKQAEMMSRMISNISHDFKTPLTSLIGYIELIKENENLNIDEVREYLDVAHNKACFLNSTLENFFYLSRLESKDEPFNIGQINLTDIVKEQIMFFYSDFKKLGIIPSIDIPEEDLFVLADKTSVNRILNNLLSNSIKYGKDGDKIGVSVKEESDYIYVQVWDNGKGVPDKNLPFIFDRLYTVENSRNTNLSGTGIGLSIVKQLVKNNKGTISITSVPFEKTVFTFSLPKAHWVKPEAKGN